MGRLKGLHVGFKVAGLGLGVSFLEGSKLPKVRIADPRTSDTVVAAVLRCIGLAVDGAGSIALIRNAHWIPPPRPRLDSPGSG